MTLREKQAKLTSRAECLIFGGFYADWRLNVKGSAILAFFSMTVKPFVSSFV